VPRGKNILTGHDGYKASTAGNHDGRPEML